IIKLSDSVTDTVNIDHGLVAGGIEGAAGVVNVLGTTVEVTLGHKHGAGAVDGGTPMTAFSLASGSILQIDVNAVPNDPTVDPAVSGNNGYISYHTINITPGAQFVAGVKPGDFNTTILHPGETILYRDVIKADTAQTGLVTVAGTKGNFGAIYTTSGVFTAELLPDDGASTTDPTDGGSVGAADLRLPFIGFGAGFGGNGAGPPLGETPNQRSTGHGVDTILDIPGAIPLTSLLFADSGPQLLKDLDQISGVQYAADFNQFAGAPIQSSGDIQTLLWARNGQLAGGKMERQGLKQIASAGISDTNHVAQIPATGPSAEHWSVWGRAYAVIGDAKNQSAPSDPNNVPGFDEHRYGGEGSAADT